MRKLWITVLIAAVALLSACGQATPAAPAAAATPTRQEASPVAQVATKNPAAVEMTCQLVSLSPTQSPDDQSNFPPAGKDDWTLGNLEKPVMTLIEYSDFQ